MRNKPFLISALVFGLIGTALLVIAGISFMTNSTAFAKAIASIMNSNPTTISNAIIAELGVVFMIPSFIFAYKSFIETEDEMQVIDSVRTVEPIIEQIDEPKAESTDN